MRMADKKGVKVAAQNRKAHHDYFVEDRYEAGIELFGTSHIYTSPSPRDRR